MSRHHRQWWSRLCRCHLPAGRGGLERGTAGATCINIDCVPSKILVSAVHVAHVRAASPFDSGISAVPPGVSRVVLQAQQQARVEELRKAKYDFLLDSGVQSRGYAYR